MARISIWQPTSDWTRVLSRLDPSGPDDARRVLVLRRDEVREFGLRHAHRICTVFCKPFAYIRRGNRTRDVACKLVYDASRGTGRRPNPIPNREFETRDSRFRQRWHLRQNDGAPSAAHPQGHEPAFANGWQGERDGRQPIGNAPRNRVADRLGRCHRNVYRFDARDEVEFLRSQVSGGAHTGGAELELTWPCLCWLDQFSAGLDTMRFAYAEA